MSAFDRLRPRERLFCQSLLTQSIRGAAKAAGISEPTARRWVKRQEILDALKELEADTLAELSRRLLTLADAASAVLAQTLTEKGVKDADRLRAVDLTWSNLFRFRELHDIEERLQILEAQNESANTD